MAHLSRVGGWLSYFRGNCEEAVKTRLLFAFTRSRQLSSLFNFLKGLLVLGGNSLGCFIQGVLALSPKLSHVIWRYGLSCFPIIIRWQTQRRMRWKNKDKARHKEEEMRKWSWKLECGEKDQVSLSTNMRISGHSLSVMTTRGKEFLGMSPAVFAILKFVSHCSFEKSLGLKLGTLGSSENFP